MNLKKLSGDELIVKLKGLAGEERRLATEILHHLREVERRRLFAEMGYSSLYEFCVEELRYSRGAAHRRISAMRLLKDIPEIEPAIASGEISLTAVSTLQDFFRTEKNSGNPYSLESKKELFESSKGKSKRDIERQLAELSPNAYPREIQKPLAVDKTEIRFVANDVLLAKIEKLKSLLSHRSSTFADLVETVVEIALKKLDPRSRKSGGSPASAPRVNSSIIPRPLRTAVWIRDKGACTYKSPKSGRVCGSNYALQIDHIEPFSQGGKTELENLRLVCHAHNQYLAIQAYGAQKMSKYISLE